MSHEDEDIKTMLAEIIPPLTPPEDRVGAVARRVRRKRGRRLIGSSALAVALVVSVSVAGGQILTGGDHVPPARTPAVGSAPDRWTSCAQEAPEFLGRDVNTAPSPAVLHRLSGDFIPVAVVICQSERQQRVDGGTDAVLTERRSDEVAALAAALRLPDVSSTNLNCFAVFPWSPWLALVDGDGRWIRPVLPHNSCRDPLPEVRAAFDALPLTTVATLVIRETVSAGAAASGCEQTVGEMVSAEMLHYPDGRPGTLPAPFPAGQQIRLCVYDVPESEQGNGKPAGNFVHGTVLSADRRTAIEQALLGAGPIKPCTAYASRFALLGAVSGQGPWTYVELDGCRRLMVVPPPGGSVTAQGDAALAGLIDKQ